MKLYLIRHAQSANNAAYFSGDYHKQHNSDPEITPLGHQQAERVGQLLASPDLEPRQPPDMAEKTDFGLTHLYCSLMTRAILTGGYIAQACQLPLQAHHDIFERLGIYSYNDAGERVGLAGPNRDYFAQRFPELQLPDSIGQEGWWNRPVETNEQFVARVARAAADIWQRHGDSNDCVGLVVHGDFIDQFVNEILDVPRRPANYDSAWEGNWAFHNTSVSRFDFVSGSPVVVYLNRVDHLPAEWITW
ncbi:MAG: histidine phosphatase family protein [Chloroflexota bacterium]